MRPPSRRAAGSGSASGPSCSSGTCVPTGWPAGPGRRRSPVPAVGPRAGDRDRVVTKNGPDAFEGTGRAVLPRRERVGTVAAAPLRAPVRTRQAAAARRSSPGRTPPRPSPQHRRGAPDGGRRPARVVPLADGVYIVSVPGPGTRLLAVTATPYGSRAAHVTVAEDPLAHGVELTPGEVDAVSRRCRSARRRRAPPSPRATSLPRAPSSWRGRGARSSSRAGTP